MIAGHCAVHYLSALAQAYKNAGVGEQQREKIGRKLFRMVDGLKECGAHNGGFLWAAPRTADAAPESQFDHLEQGRTNIKTEAWVPWYTMHKLVEVFTNILYSIVVSTVLCSTTGLASCIVLLFLSSDYCHPKRFLVLQ